ncbi:hypothetical protein NVI2019_PEGOAJLN_03322 [Providencia alcalifaciens]|uniref:DUF6630 family protein n=1 Tax=Providencia alcalifaciens TaxID=126385 RepID=UPI00044E3931|nr:hypothetical protein [Providencia alcalifaciens]EUD01651.1 hypothetical protein HMPREF1565_2404 [Providencia alcalifaciens RIMD 1656011]CAG9431892.1 hypothetical protein NVI2019_PEGOAJLN_03322 [Providencia alcalifaciens]
MQGMNPETVDHYNDIMPMITKLAALLNPHSAENATTDISSFEEELNEWISEDEEGFVESIEEGEVGYLMADLIVRSNMGNSFWIDWKDSESAVGFLDSALECEGLDIQLDFAVKDPKNDLRPDQIFVRANQQLQALGYYLLGLTSGNDAYHEILIPSGIFEPFMDIMEHFDVMVELNDEEVDYSE